MTGRGEAVSTFMQIMLVGAATAVIIQLPIIVGQLMSIASSLGRIASALERLSKKDKDHSLF
ncbi:hypothetical protein C5B42_03580 [Candidatus Cerribacteria bacterium 'Amazon FNV 2010 28 9']|uniref:Uncharacterized protein n=1 Tax=Candidatus Cerribacteria bacterium 'Amazon FNV 2010 28 9' TaxID=2081795 RepID=A0A317JPP1_9BACT|nr:MAG: hypothetical protein C5B42_03580 [Candidatus Cerribacteria bacterium 'Amazon FNV 2010 28 9']